MTQVQSNPVVKKDLPGQSNTDFALMVREYLSNFTYYRIQKDLAVREQLYAWCSEYMGEKYRDWFVYEGGQYDKWWTVNIRSPKHCTLFCLRWADIIIDSVDKTNRN